MERQILPPPPAARKQVTEAEQRLLDEKTTFELAACMLDAYSFILTKNGCAVVGIITRVGNLLKRDPTFMLRFKNARIAVAAEEDRQAKAAAQAQPTVTAP